MSQHIRIENASPSWKLIMQSGAGVTCTVGLPVGTLLTGELAIPQADLARTDVVLLDGMPVDDIAAAVVGNNARLALAAGLPGIAGLAMKRGSAVRALRGGITHTPNTMLEAMPDTAPDPEPGRITLFLYSLTIDMLGAHFLRRGVIVTAEQFRRYACFAPENVCFVAGERMKCAEASRSLEEAVSAEFFLTADIPPEKSK